MTNIIKILTLILKLNKICLVYNAIIRNNKWRRWYYLFFLLLLFLFYIYSYVLQPLVTYLELMLLLKHLKVNKYISKDIWIIWLNLVLFLFC
jgi:hypothetical protein